MVSAKKLGSAKIHKSSKPGKIEKHQKPEKKTSKVLKVMPDTASIIKEEVPKTTKRKKFVMPSKYVTENVANLCLDALQQLAVQYKKKNAIFEDETPIFAEIHCIKIQNTRGNIKL